MILSNEPHDEPRDGPAFWKLDSLSNRDVLERLRSALVSSRQRMAELVAHLGEVEVRRLHLEAACSSMFDYCVNRLGLSEDEACRRIDVARLARRFPRIFLMLASGELSLSVASLLKPHLTIENAASLLAAVTRQSIRQARETLAALFPQPDIRSSMRKLPTHAQRLPSAPPSAPPTVTPQRSPTLAPASSLGFESRERALVPMIEPSEATPPPATAVPVAPAAPAILSNARQAATIEPLSPARYKVQFTADADLKAKLELARDLMRHAVPDGDLAAIVARALDLLVERVMQHRFGARKERPAANESARPPVTAPAEPTAPAAFTTPSSHIARATRRAVAERDGLRCNYTDEHGNRCEARAWLEYDHRKPRAKGGAHTPDNLRLLCRNHNRLAAELAYGADHIADHIADAIARRSHRETQHQAHPPTATRAQFSSSPDESDIIGCPPH